MYRHMQFNTKILRNKCCFFWNLRKHLPK